MEMEAIFAHTPSSDLGSLPSSKTPVLQEFPATATAGKQGFVLQSEPSRGI